MKADFKSPPSQLSELEYTAVPKAPKISVTIEAIQKGAAESHEVGILDIPPHSLMESGLPEQLLLLPVINHSSPQPRE